VPQPYTSAMAVDETARVGTDLRIGVVGATGAVGRVTLELLLDRGYTSIRTFASRRSAGGRLGDFEVEEASEATLGAGDLDLCLFSVGTSTSRELVPIAAGAGAVCIDKSSAFRLQDSIPLVVPEVNGERAFEHTGIIANPNCCTIPLTMALAPLRDAVFRTFESYARYWVDSFRLPGMSHDEIDAGLDDRLADATLDLVNIRSVSGDESAVLDAVDAALPAGFDVVDREDSVLFAVPSTRRDRAPFVVLAGHVDTVPHHGNAPGTRDDAEIVGRGAADMKGAIAVMLETAVWLAAHPGASDLDIGLLFFGREELPITQSALLPLFERCPLTRSIDLAVVMEPTAKTAPPPGSSA